MHSINKERRKLQIDSASEKQRYRMYKSGKTWMFASATMLFFGAEGIFGHANIVKADETEASTHTATVQKSIANTVTIHYVDTLGNEIAPTQTLANGKSGDGFVTPAAPTVAGYELLDPATQSGAFTDGHQNITVK
ncbi:MucBP domain-containing protein [Lacticaseibacillus paracasei]|uniref:MucBP domain-containing protein n=1 Tax=Lacticaseibacillus paracasei TaxID=1597 RepID=UPI000FEF9D8B|nr:MucBP domain-containing protein [Lacticaseibacillus paracasei]RND51311.1 KxYKxGKxW signal peptide [Lacticaseibacillus paracasei]